MGMGKQLAVSLQYEGALCRVLSSCASIATRGLLLTECGGVEMLSGSHVELERPVFCLHNVATVLFAPGVLPGVPTSPSKGNGAGVLQHIRCSFMVCIMASFVVR
jgi:hypothetical protein